VGTGRAGRASAVGLAHARDLPAIDQMAERGARFVLWRHEVRKGKETKVPLRTNGRLAGTSTSSWAAALAEREKAAEKLQEVAGIGFGLAAERASMRRSRLGQRARP
jgi:hypothetical protein